MELKQKKPIHLRCPKCGYDFAYNTNHIEEEIVSITSDIQRYKRKHRITIKSMIIEIFNAPLEVGNAD